MNSTDAETKSHMWLSEGDTEERIIDGEAEYSVLEGTVMKELQTYCTLISV